MREMAAMAMAAAYTPVMAQQPAALHLGTQGERPTAPSAVHLRWAAAGVKPMLWQASPKASRTRSSVVAAAGGELGYVLAPLTPSLWPIAACIVRFLMGRVFQEIRFVALFFLHMLLPERSHECWRMDGCPLFPPF